MENPFHLTLDLYDDVVQATYYDNREENDDLYDEIYPHPYITVDNKGEIDGFKALCLKRGADYALRQYLHQLSFETRAFVTTNADPRVAEGIERDCFESAYDWLIEQIKSFKENADLAGQSAGQV